MLSKYLTKFCQSIRQLIPLAETRFDLSVPERELLQKVTDDKDTDDSADDDALNNPANAVEGNQNPKLRASLIAWLCTDPEASSFLTHRGLSIVGAKIEGTLNLKFASLEFPMVFRRCTFTEPIRLEWAKVKFLDLSGSYLASSQICDVSGSQVTASLEARGIHVESDVLLRNVKSTGLVSLEGATIRRNLDCSNGKFQNSEEPALVAQGAEIKGTALFRNVTVTGLVSLDRATIGGDLIGDDGTFKNPKGSAVELSSAEIKGAVLFRNVTAAGLVDLFATTIGGDFDCRKGKFENPGNPSLRAKLAEIKGYVYLSDEFKSTGEVSLSATTIGGDLDCSKGTFYNPGKPSLLAKLAEIKGDVYLSDEFKSTGLVLLNGATIGRNLICKKGTFYNPQKASLAAVGAEIKGVVVLSNVKSTGCVSLTAAIIGGNLICRNGMFCNPGGPALIAQSSEIRGSAFLGDGLRASGSISFRDAIIKDRINMIDMKQRCLSYLYGSYKMLPLATLKLSFHLIRLYPLIGVSFLRILDSPSLDLSYATVQALADAEES